MHVHLDARLRSLIRRQFEVAASLFSFSSGGRSGSPIAKRLLTRSLSDAANRTQRRFAPPNYARVGPRLPLIPASEPPRAEAAPRSTFLSSPAAKADISCREILIGDGNGCNSASWHSSSRRLVGRWLRCTGSESQYVPEGQIDRDGGDPSQFTEARPGSAAWPPVTQRQRPKVFAPKA